MVSMDVLISSTLVRWFQRWEFSSFVRSGCIGCSCCWIPVVQGRRLWEALEQERHTRMNLCPGKMKMSKFSCGFDVCGVDSFYLWCHVGFHRDHNLWREIQFCSLERETHTTLWFISGHYGLNSLRICREHVSQLVPCSFSSHMVMESKTPNFT